jgi:MFS family permease
MSHDIARSPDRGTPVRSELALHWRVLLGCFLGIAAGGASLYFYATGLLIKPVAAAFEVSRTEASLAPLLGALLLGITAPLFGWCSERWGTVRVAACGYAGMALGLFVLGSLVTHFHLFLVVNCLVGLAAGATSPGVLTRPVVLAFQRQRGIALGVAVAGTGVGAIGMPIFLVRVIERFGWQGGYVALGSALLALAPLALWFLRHSPERSRGTGDRAALAPVHWGDPHLLRLLLMFLLVSAAAVGSMVHVVPLITDRGVSAQDAGGFAALLGVAIVAARLLTGWLLDRFEAAALSATLFTVSAAGLLMLGSGASWALLPGLLLLGLAVGSEHDLAAYLVGRRFSRRYGLVFGALYAVTALGVSLGPMLAARVFDVTGSYQGWMWSSIGMLLVAALIALSLRAPPRSGRCPSRPPPRGRKKTWGGPAFSWRGIIACPSRGSPRTARGCGLTLMAGPARRVDETRRGVSNISSTTASGEKDKPHEIRTNRTSFPGWQGGAPGGSRAGEGACHRPGPRGGPELR